MLGLIAFYTSAPLRCALRSTLSHPLIISKEAQGGFFFHVTQAPRQSLHKRKLNSSHDGKSFVQKNLSDISIISEVTGFLLENRCNCCLQPLLLSAAFQRQEWNETEGQGSSALHTGGHNTERELGSMSDRVNRKLGKTGSNSSTNSTGMALLSTSGRVMGNDGSILKQWVCVTVYLSGVGLCECVSRIEQPNCAEISTC